MKLSTFVRVGALVTAMALGGVTWVDAGQQDSRGARPQRPPESGTHPAAQQRSRARERHATAGRAAAGRANEVAPAPQAPPAANRQYAVPRPVAPAAPPARSYGYPSSAYRYPANRYPAYRYPAPSYPYYGPARRPYYGRYYAYRYYPRSYYPATRVVPVPVPVYPVPHYYGSGGHFSVYFGWGSGYIYGAPYNGPVYGYMAPPASGATANYGDVRLQVTPRDAAVYVDGYYAGIVDDFDGAFQRLTLEVGPHRIELDAQGSDPRFFDVYVDPARTVDIHADLFR